MILNSIDELERITDPTVLLECVVCDGGFHGGYAKSSLGRAHFSDQYLIGSHGVSDRLLHNAIQIECEIST